MAPDVYCLIALLHIYSRTLRPYLAEHTLFNLIRECLANNCPEFRPKAIHFEMVIRCWLKQTASKEVGLKRAGRLLLEAVELDKELRLNLLSQSLHLILSAWAESGLSNAPSRAAALLKAYQSKSTKPALNVSFELVKKMQSCSEQQQKSSTGSSTN
jgi:hypothetical protein